MARAKTELEQYLVYGVDEKNRRVYFGTSLAHVWDEDNAGGFNQTSCEYAIRAVERMATDHPKTPIEIHMMSYGGDPYSMLALYDVIQATTCQIKFYGKGSIMSAATWIMCGADERHLYPNTRVMVHNGWTEAAGKVTDVEISIEEERFLQKRLEEIYEENSRMPFEFWHEICKRDLYLSAEEAIQLGLADRIVHPKRRGNYRKVRQHHLSQKIDKRKITKLTKKLLDRIQATPGKMEITINTPKVEPVDDRLTIEPMPQTESKAEDKKDN